jgi:hypothetical protein
MEGDTMNGLLNISQTWVSGRLSGGTQYRGGDTRDILLGNSASGLVSSVVTVAKRLYTIPITAQFGAQLEHHVTDEAAAAGRQSGQYQALCGCLFLAAPMAAPVGRPCAACAAILAASRRAAAPPAAHQSRHGLISRLLHFAGLYLPVVSRERRSVHQPILTSYRAHR